MNKQQRLVSVVIPCYNQGRFLDDSIESVKSQTYGNIELIIVNDGSDDEETIGILGKLGTTNPEIKIINQGNMGLSEARNSGVRLAGGRYVVCLDADDMLAPSYIKKATSIFESDKSGKIGFVTTWDQEFGDRDGIWKAGEYNVGRLLVENIAHAGSMFRKEAWEKVGGYKREMDIGYEDWEFWISIVEQGYRWELITEALFLYRVRGGSMLSKANAEHLELYSRIVHLHTKFFASQVEGFACTAEGEISTLRDTVNENTKRFDKANQALKNEVQHLSDELSMLRNSRVIAPSIKIRNVLLKIKNNLK